MKKILPILLLAYCFSITRQDIYNDSWALLIGIDKYENMPRLDYAVKDAESMEEMLINLFGFPQDNVTVLKNEQATEDNIMKSLEDISGNAKEDDRVLIFFAGHGETISHSGGGESGYLVPVDGNSERLLSTAIKMEALKDIALMSDARHILYLIDACYGGTLEGNYRGLSTSSSHLIEKISKLKGRQAISAGGRGEKVIEKSEWGHSAFTMNLLYGLKDWRADINNDDFITTIELGLFLEKHVTSDSEHQQTPKFMDIGRSADEGTFVFFKPLHIESSNIVNTQSVISSESINNNSSDLSLNWEYTRDNTFGFIANSDWAGVFISYDGFLDNGYNAWSTQLGALVFKNNIDVVLSAGVKKYFSSYSDMFFSYGIGFHNYSGNFGSDEEDIVYHAITPYIGIGNIDNRVPSDGASKFKKTLFKITQYTEVKIGYRFIKEEAIDDINVKPGLSVNFSFGLFDRTQLKSAKVLPE